MVMERQFIEHIPVMPKEAIDFLQVKKDGLYIDTCLGGGGHTALIAALLGKKGKVIGIDQDIEAIGKAKERLVKYKNKIIYINDNFKNLDKIINCLAISKVDGILFDLGVSSYHLENPERGFSFSEKKENLNAQLDMRMDRCQELTAEQVVNQYKKEQLKKILIDLAEERYAEKIVRNIILERKIKLIKTTKDLLQIIKKSIPFEYRLKKKNYAANVFRALRMEVNQELPCLKQALPKAISLLNSGGRLVVISFHSLEDRIVKDIFKEKQKNEIKLLTKKPLTPSREEIKQNPKSRSAKLRALEKI